MQKDLFNSDIKSVSRTEYIYVNRWITGSIGIKLNGLWYYTNDSKTSDFIRGDLKTLLFLCTKSGIPSLVLHSKEDSNGIFMIYDDEYFVSSKSTLNKVLVREKSGLVLRNVKLLPKKL